MSSYFLYSDFSINYTDVERFLLILLLRVLHHQVTSQFNFVINVFFRAASALKGLSSLMPQITSRNSPKI
jgi:hypothetical protein